MPFSKIKIGLAMIFAGKSAANDDLIFGPMEGDFESMEGVENSNPNVLRSGDTGAEGNDLNHSVKGRPKAVSAPIDITRDPQLDWKMRNWVRANRQTGRVHAQTVIRSPESMSTDDSVV